MANTVEALDGTRSSLEAGSISLSEISSATSTCAQCEWFTVSLRSSKLAAEEEIGVIPFLLVFLLSKKAKFA